MALHICLLSFDQKMHILHQLLQTLGFTTMDSHTSSSSFSSSPQLALVILQLGISWFLEDSNFTECNTLLQDVPNDLKDYGAFGARPSSLSSPFFLNCLTMKLRAPRSFKNSVTPCPATEDHNPQNWNLEYPSFPQPVRSTDNTNCPPPPTSPPNSNKNE